MEKRIFKVIFIFLVVFGHNRLFPFEIDTRPVKFGNSSQKINFIQKVLNTSDRTYLPDVAKLLDDEDEDVRSKAAYTLWKIGDSSCVEYFKNGLQDEYWLVRYYSIMGLLKYGTGKDLPEFYNALDDPYWKIRYYAVNGIGKYGNPSSIDILVSHINDTNEKVKEEILWSLTKLMWTPEGREKFKELPDSKVENIFKFITGTNLFLKIRTIWLIEASRDKRGVPYLIKGLDDLNDEVKIRCVWALESLKATEAADEIEGLLSDASVQVKIESVKTLVRMKSEEGLEGIVRGLSDPDESVRVYSLWAIEKFKNESTYPEIVKCLDDESEAVKEYAYQIILKLKDPLFILVLERFVDNSEYSINSRVTALNLLGKIGDESVKNYLIKKIQDPEQLIRYAAIEAFSYLDRFDGRYLETLAYLEKYDSCQRVRNLCRRILKNIVDELIKASNSYDSSERELVIEKSERILSAEESKALIYKMLLSEFPEIRSKAVELVIKKPEKIFATGIKQALKETDIETRKMAAIAIGEIGDRTAIPLLKEGLKHFDPEFQIYCAWAIAKMGDNSAFPYGMSYIDSPNPLYQKKAAEIFAYLKNKKASGKLIEKLKNGELDVKVVCAWALARMGNERGFEFLVRLTEQDIEPLRTLANIYLRDNEIPLSLRAKIPQIREKIYHEKLGIQEVKEKFMFAYKVVGGIDIDGNEDDRYWQMVEKTNSFIRIEEEKVSSGIQTKVAAGYDEKNVYFLIICEDQSKSEIDLNTRDFITLSINPFNSDEKWYQFVLHPMGLVKYSYVWKFYQDDEPEKTWQSNWIAKTKVEANKWVAEIAIPLSDLGIKEIKSGDRWDVNFLREIHQKPATTWTGRIDNPEQFGIMIFKGEL